MITEADECLIGLDPDEAKKIALENLHYQRLCGETMGVIQMYEDAARRAGATPEEIERTRWA